MTAMVEQAGSIPEAEEIFRRLRTRWPAILAYDDWGDYWMDDGGTLRRVSKV
jgi:hypothetical protein